MSEQREEFWTSEEVKIRWKDNPKEYMRQYNRNYQIKNHERLLRQRRERYRKNRKKEMKYIKEWQKKNPIKYREYVFRSQYRKKLRIINKLGGKCSKCGYDDLASLEIHHLDPTVKERDNDYKKEGFDLEKVVLLCANCHRKEHYSSLWKKFLEGEK